MQKHFFETCVAPLNAHFSQKHDISKDNLAAQSVRLPSPNEEKKVVCCHVTAVICLSGQEIM